jgi:hypothetical protein
MFKVRKKLKMIFSSFGGLNSKNPIDFSAEVKLSVTFAVLQKFQKSKDKFYPWPLCIGSKGPQHEQKTYLAARLFIV